MRVVTTNLRDGYLRKNGVPYSQNAVVTEYFDRVPGPDDAQWLIVKTTVERPRLPRAALPLERALHARAGRVEVAAVALRGRSAARPHEVRCEVAMRTQCLAVVLLLAVAHVAAAAVPPVPAVSAVVGGPGAMYPNPPINVVSGATRVEDFPYVTEEFFVSGTAQGAPYTTRLIVRRPSDPATFSGVVVAEALHAGGRSLVFEWSRVSILARRHMFVEIVHSPANIGLLKTFNADRYAALGITMGQTNEIIAQVGLLMKSGTGPFAAYRVQRITLMGTSASSGTVRNYLADHAALRMARRRSDLRRVPADEHQRQHAAAHRGRADDPDAHADRGGDVGRDGHRLPPARQRRARQPLQALRSRGDAPQQLARQPGVCQRSVHAARDRFPGRRVHRARRSTTWSSGSRGARCRRARRR